MKTNILTAVLLVATLTGCAGGVRNWKEQVILPDGRELIVERSHTLASRFDREFSAFNAPPRAASYELRVPLAEGYTAPWTAEHKDMIPIAVAGDGKTVYVVASPSCPTFQKMGQPIPPFIVFKHEEKAWQKTTISEFPVEITEANLMIGTSGKRSVDEIEKGLVTAKAIRRLNEVNPTRKIYRHGIDKYFWAACGVKL